MNGEEIAGLVAQGISNGLLQGVLLLAPYFIGFCVLCLLIRVIRQTLRKKGTASQKDSPKDLQLADSYQSKPLFSQHEKDAYRKLKEIADKRGYMIFAKVRLLDLLEPVRKHPNYRTLFNKIQAKHVDFVLCDYDLEPYMIIELDDRSHDVPKRKERDQFVDEVLTQCGYRIIHTREITADIFNDAITH